MTYANYDDALAQIDASGIRRDKDLAFDSRAQRWFVEGEDREKRGWTRLREWQSKSGAIYIVGTYGVWHGNDPGTLKIEISSMRGAALSDEDRAAIREANKAAAKRQAEERRIEAKTAATWAAAVWSKCAPCSDHEYLTRKGIQGHGVRQLVSIEDIAITGIDESNWYRLGQAIGALVVPMHDQHANVCGIQFIYPKGHKRCEKIKAGKEFWPSGMAMGGTFGLIGPVQRSGILLVTEGYATAASLVEATGQSVAYAFSANNLAKAGKLLRKAYPMLRLLFCADDDYLTDGNPGCSAAAAATAEIERAAWTQPDFTGPDGADLRGGKKLTDYNDLAQLVASPLVLANQINAKLDELKWKDAARAGVPSQPGDGDSDDDGRRRAVSVMALDDAIERFLPLDDGTGKYLFDSWTAKIAHRDQMAAVLPAGMRGDDVKRHPRWIERGAYYLDQVGFDPSGKDRAVKLNTWRGWPMQPVEGNCTLLLELLQHLCNNEGHKPELVQWVLRWMAYPLQHPGAKMASAIIMHGPQGTGKSTVFKALAKIYGDADSYRNYSVILDQKALQSDFNSDWDSKLFILAEEVVNSSDKWQLRNELKELVTGSVIRINRKFVDAYYQTNRCNMVFLSNENQPLPIDNDDRRHLVIWTPPPVPIEFYLEVVTELEAGGYAAFYHYLLNLDLGDFHPNSRPPMTEAKLALINLSLPSEIRFVNEFIAGDTEFPVVPCLSSDFYGAYQRWCRINGESRPRASNQFFGAVTRLTGWEKKKCRVYSDGHCLGETITKNMIFPPPDALQRCGTAMPPGENAPSWLTGCWLRFKNSTAEGEKWAA